VANPFVTIAAFDSMIEADLVRGILEEEGIPVILSGEHATSAFAGITALAEITLAVPEEELDRANRLLDEFESEPDEQVEALAEGSSEAGWVCSLCGQFVEDAATACPSCQTPRDAVRDGSRPQQTDLTKRPRIIRLPRPPEQAVQRRDQMTDRPLPQEFQMEDETDSDLHDVATFLGDDMARRAFLAAMLGLLFTPLVFYSGWCLLKLLTYSGEVSPSGMRYLYGAIALDVLGVLLFLALLAAFRPLGGF